MVAENALRRSEGALHGATLDARPLSSSSAGFPIWLIDTKGCRPHALEHLLSSEEQAKADRFRLPALRNRYIAAHGSLHLLLQDDYGIPIEDQILEKNQFGKPRLKHFPNLHYSMSYSGDYAMIGVSQNDEIGVDIEVSRSVEDAAELTEAHFTQAEQAAVRLKSAGVETRFSQAFLEIWVRKEACVKAFGCGLDVPLNEMECGNEDRTAIVRLNEGLCKTGFVQRDGGPIMAWARCIKNS
jgi:4'-phosphopantetheinyl transferase